MGQTEVVVRPHHHPLFAFDDDDGVFGAGNRLEVRIQPSSLDLARPGEVLTLVEQRDVLQGVCAHEASGCDWNAVVQVSPGGMKWQGGEIAGVSEPGEAW